MKVRVAIREEDAVRFAQKKEAIYDFRMRRRQGQQWSRMIGFNRTKRPDLVLRPANARVIYRNHASTNTITAKAIGTMHRTLSLISLSYAASLLLAVAFAPAAQAQAVEPLTVVTASGRHAFSVEVMRTPEGRAKGLMFRNYMPPDRGMLFDFARVEPVSMWMQNTFISLDMLFIRSDGTVARVAENTEPLSTRTIPSGEPVLSVLELNAGIAAKIGVKAGDKVEHPLFGK
jgi:uncharacterized protein